MNSRKKLMRLAISEAESNETPFGAVLAMGDEPVVTAVNTTMKAHDPTAHAEVNVIRELGKLTQNTDFSGYTLYSTVEPCPMCASAVIWANIRTVVFGASIDDIKPYTPQITIPCTHIFAQSNIEVEVSTGVLSSECLELAKRFY